MTYLHLFFSFIHMLRQSLKAVGSSRSSGLCHHRFAHTMNRPRNRQPRPPRNNTNGPNNHKQFNRGPHQGGGNVPTTQQVKPGVSVSIVLKADQATGREVQGVVQDLLTRGDHPRGIKVRLQDGRIGRVQRMVNSGASLSTNTQQAPSQSAPVTLIRNQARDVSDPMQNGFHSKELNTPPTVRCPMCDFEGDTDAVSYHVQQHLD